MGKKFCAKKCTTMAKLLTLMLTIPTISSPIGIAYAENEATEEEFTQEDTNVQEAVATDQESVQEVTEPAAQTEEPATETSAPATEIVYVPTNSDDYATLQAKYDELERLIAQMNAQLAGLQQNSNNTTNSVQYANLQNQISSLASRVENLNGQVSRANSTNSSGMQTLSSQSASLKNDVKMLRDQVNSMNSSSPYQTSSSIAPLVVDMRTGQTGYTESRTTSPNPQPDTQVSQAAVVTDIVDVVRKTPVDRPLSVEEQEMGILLTQEGEIDLNSVILTDTDISDLSYREMSAIDDDVYITPVNQDAITVDLNMILLPENDVLLTPEAKEATGFIPQCMAVIGLSAGNFIYDMSTMSQKQYNILMSITIMTVFFAILVTMFIMFAKKNGMLFYKNTYHDEYEDFDAEYDEMLDETFEV